MRIIKGCVFFVSQNKGFIYIVIRICVNREGAAATAGVINMTLLGSLFKTSAIFVPRGRK